MYYALWDTRLSTPKLALEDYFSSQTIYLECHSGGLSPDLIGRNSNCAIAIPIRSGVKL